MKWPTQTEILFSVKTFVAGMLALYFAMRIGLPRPFWSLMTVYVISQPLAGAVRSKALYRIVGTAIGAMVAVILVPRLINYSVLLTLALSLWMAICLYVSLLDRTPRSYMFILSGYTATLVAFPSIVDMTSFSVSTMFDASLARVEEITIGIVCATVVHSLIFPQSIGPIILKRMDQALADAQRWIRDALLCADEQQRATDHSKLAQDITELRLMSTHLPFDTSNLRWTSHVVRTLQDRLAALVPLLSAIEDRVRTLQENDTAGMLSHWKTLLTDITNWAQQGTCYSQQEATQLRRRIADAAPAIDGSTCWCHALEVSIVAELDRLIDACEACFHLRQQIDAGMNGDIPETARKLSRIPTRELHTDRGLALMSSFAAAIAICASCAFWIFSGWPAGFLAPMMAGMFCMFFATMDDPVPALKVSFYYTVYSGPIAGLYLLWLLPSAHSFEMLMLVLAPFFIAGGILMARPSTVARASPFVFAVIATLTMYDMGMADMTAFINGQISQAIGIGMAALTTLLLRSVNAEWTARRLLRAGWQEIARLGQAVKAPPVIAVTVRMVDRISLLAPRLAAAGIHRDLAAFNALEDLRVGLNMTFLLRIRSRLQRNDISVQPLLDGLSEHFRNRSAQPSNMASVLLEKIDGTLHSVCCTPPFMRRNEAVAALTGIRRDLFPEALPYQPETQIKKEV